MKPKPFSPLNHFTVPSGMFPPSCPAPAAACHLTVAGRQTTTCPDVATGVATDPCRVLPGTRMPVYVEPCTPEAARPSPGLRFTLLDQCDETVAGEALEPDHPGGRRRALEVVQAVLDNPADGGPVDVGSEL